MDRLKKLLATLEAQPSTTQELLLRRFVEAWLKEQRAGTRPGTTEGTKTTIPDSRQAVPLEDVILAQAFQLEALLNVLERQGVIRKTEVLEEIRALRAKTPKGT